LPPNELDFGRYVDLWPKGFKEFPIMFTEEELSELNGCP